MATIAVNRGWPPGSQQQNRTIVECPGPLFGDTSTMSEFCQNSRTAISAYRFSPQPTMPQTSRWCRLPGPRYPNDRTVCWRPATKSFARRRTAGRNRTTVCTDPGQPDVGQKLGSSRCSGRLGQSLLAASQAAAAFSRRLPPLRTTSCQWPTPGQAQQHRRTAAQRTT